MNKTLTTLVIGSFTLTSILTSTPVFAKNDNGRGKSEERGKSPVTFVRNSDDNSDKSRTKILDNGKILKVQTVGPSRLKDALNIKLKLDESNDDDELKIKVPKGTMTSSSEAFVAAVKTALQNYKNTVNQARIDLLNAIAAARAQFITSTPPVSTNTAPIVQTAAGANPSNVSGTTTTLSVLGSDDKPESQLTYTWSFVKPLNAVNPTFSVNGTNSAKNTLVTFVSPGTYTFTVTIRDAGNLTVQSSTNVTVTNNAPVITTTATANPSPVSGTTSTLSVQATDDSGPGNLTYSWTTTAKPGSVFPSFSVNNSNSASTTVVTFPQAGSYTFRVVVTDSNALSAESSVNVTVNQSLTSVSVSPATTTVSTGSSTTFTGSAFDQFNLPQSAVFNWSIFEGILGGSINSLGVYTASTTTGTFHVIGTTNSKSATSTVTVQ
jgi:hypothetical protein